MGPEKNPKRGAKDENKIPRKDLKRGEKVKRKKEEVLPSYPGSPRRGAHHVVNRGIHSPYIYLATMMALQ